MIAERLRQLGYEYKPAATTIPGFPIRTAVRVGNLVFTSGQGPAHDGETIRGKVGTEIDLATAQKAAEYCALNCLQAVGAVADIESVTRIVKVLGMVNVAEDFVNMSEVINGCSQFLESVFGDSGVGARSAVGMVLPGNIAVEIEMIVEVS